MVNRQVNGSFAGADEGNARLAQAIAATDFNERAGVEQFLAALDDDLRHDNRPGRKRKPTGIKEQLRKGATAQRVYELIYGLEYLTAEFWLESDARPISQLSPGQRGTLLLLFYLLVDKSRRPIVLDQPEENLDNQTVHELLVPAIAEARRSRQVIAVTHNPNLAVVGDADQVIVAEMTAQKFHYVSGAIEDPEINGRIVEILEGTWPAFQNRRDKYTPTSVLDQRG
jgi:ATPase subunit of ABC transporter with duplicated ATPase domains